MARVPALGDDPRRIAREIDQLERARLEREFFGPPDDGPQARAGGNGRAFHGYDEPPPYDGYHYGGPAFDNARGPGQQPPPAYYGAPRAGPAHHPPAARDRYDDRGDVHQGYGNAPLPGVRDLLGDIIGYEDPIWGGGRPQPVQQRHQQPAQHPAPRARRDDAIHDAGVGERVARELDRLNVQDPVVIHSIGIYFTRTVDGVAVKHVISVPEDKDPSTIRRDLCELMGLDPASAHLGFKTSRDKAKDPPRAFKTRDDVKSAIELVVQLKKAARSKAVDMEVINLKAPSSPPKKAGSGKKRSRAQSTVDDDEQSDGVGSNTKELKLLRAALLCSSKTCGSPGEANRTKFCRVGPDGVHEPVTPPEMAFWACRMATDPENVDVNNPPAVGVYDAKRSKKNTAKNTPKPLTMPNININISKDLLESPPAKRQRVKYEPESPPRKIKHDPDASPRKFKVKKEARDAPLCVKKEVPDASLRVKKEDPELLERAALRKVKAEDPEVIDLTFSDDVEIVEVGVKPENID